MEEEKHIDLSSIDQSYYEQHLFQEQNGYMDFEDDDDYYIQSGNENKDQISIDSFHLLSIIGKGSYAKVALVRKKDTGKIYALKILKKSYIKQRNQKHRVLEERKVLEETSNQFVVKMKYAFQNEEKLFFVLEYCPGGELFNLLSMKEKFNEYTTQFYSGQILLALEYLHSKDIIYRDLKPENVLIDEDGYVKITDFGLSKRNVNNDNLAKSMCGTPEYLAPEVLMKQGHGKMVDFWTLGAIMFEMFCGQPPFQIDYFEKRETLFEKIKNEQPQYPDFVEGHIKDLLMGLLEKDPLKRLGSQNGTKDIKNHKFFDNFNWQKLYKKELEPPFKPVLAHDTELTYFAPEFVDMPCHSPSVQDKFFNTIESQTKEINYSKFTYLKSESNSVYSPLKQSPNEQQQSQSQNLLTLKQSQQDDGEINMICEGNGIDLCSSKNTLDSQNIQKDNLSLEENSYNHQNSYHSQDIKATTNADKENQFPSNKDNNGIDSSSEYVYIGNQ